MKIGTKQSPVRLGCYNGNTEYDKAALFVARDA